MASRAWTWLIWAGAGASAAAWALPWWPSKAAPQAVALAAVGTVVPPAPWGPLFGDAAATTTAPPSSVDASRFTVVGLLGPKEAPSPASRQMPAPAVVVLAVDGKPPRAYRVGQMVDGTWMVRSISSLGVELASGPQGQGLRLPAPVWSPSAAAAAGPAAISLVGAPAGLPPDQGIQFAPAANAIEMPADGQALPLSPAQQTEAARVRADELRARLTERRRGGSTREP